MQINKRTEEIIESAFRKKERTLFKTYETALQDEKEAYVKLRTKIFEDAAQELYPHLIRFEKTLEEHGITLHPKSYVKLSTNLNAQNCTGLANGTPAEAKYEEELAKIKKDKDTFYLKAVLEKSYDSLKKLFEEYGIQP